MGLEQKDSFWLESHLNHIVNLSSFFLSSEEYNKYNKLVVKNE